MNNAEWCLRNNIPFSTLELKRGIGRLIIIHDHAVLDEISTDFTYLEDSFAQWLDAEHKEPLLTEAECRYLKSIISPFADAVTDCFVNNNHCLIISWDDCGLEGQIELPVQNHFHGLEAGKHYTPADLDLINAEETIEEISEDASEQPNDEYSI